MENKSIENLKIAMIYGPKPVDGVSKDGHVEKIYKEQDDTAHYFYIKDFLKDHFKDEHELQKLANKNDINSIFFELQKLGHIIFAESTSTPKYKKGMFFIPSSTSDNQKKSLQNFANQLSNEDYNLMIFYNLFRSKDGIIMGNQMQGVSNILKDFYDVEPER